MKKIIETITKIVIKVNLLFFLERNFERNPTLILFSKEHHEKHHKIVINPL